jgi:hypothetical protein
VSRIVAKLEVGRFGGRQLRFPNRRAMRRATGQIGEQNRPAAGIFRHENGEIVWGHFVETSVVVTGAWHRGQRNS